MNKRILTQSLSDFFSPQMLLYSVAPFVITSALFLYLYFGIGGEYIHKLKDSLDAGIIPFIDTAKHPYIYKILTFSFVKWFVFIFFYILLSIAMILSTVFVAATIVGFLTPAIVKVVQQKHYKEIELKDDEFSFKTNIFYMIKIFTIFIILFLIAIPFLFIPALNFIAFNIPFYYLFHNMMILDIGSSINSKEEFKEIVQKNRLLFKTTTLSEYGISLIPLMGIILQVLFVIILTHQFLNKTKELRKGQIS